MIALELEEVVRVVGGRARGSAGGGLAVRGVTIDSREVKAGDLFFAIRGERHDGHDFVAQALAGGAYAAVVSDGRWATGNELPGDRLLIGVDDTVAALGKLAAFHRTLLPAVVIAVTGSNGKTTTKCMIDHVLSRRLRGRAAVKSFNNSIGVPLTLLGADAKDEYLVCEVGSNAPGEVAALGAMIGPSVAVVTSIGAAHLERLGGLEGVAREKMSLVDHVRPGGLAVVNVDEPAVRAFLPGEGGCKLVTVGAAGDADVRVTQVSGDLSETRFKINERFDVRLPICGGHHALNAAAAFAVCRRMNFSPEEIVAGLETFRPATMRLNVTRIGDVTLIDDCYNANPTSMAAAIELLRTVRGGRRVLIAGDMLELGSEAQRYHEEVGRHAASAGVERLVAVGSMRLAVMAGAQAGGDGVEVLAFRDSEAAAAQIGEYVRAGDTVLVKGSRALRMERVVEAIGCTRVSAILGGEGSPDAESMSMLTARCAAD